MQAIRRTNRPEQRSSGLFFGRSELEFHPIANVFPLMEGEEFRDLCEDIEKNGQQQPILTYEGKILDGRNRYRACLEVGEEPWVERWCGDNPVEAALSLNVHRRHLDSGQRAAIATEVEKMLAAEARKRTGGRPEKGVERIPQVSDSPDERKARTQAAKLTGTNPRYVSDAKRLKAVDPEAFEKVAKGEVSLPKAMEPHRKPKEGEPEPPKEPAVGDLVGDDFEPPPRELTPEQNNFYATQKHAAKLRKLDPEKEAEEWLEVKDDGVRIEPAIRAAADAEGYYGRLRERLETLEKEQRREAGNLRVVGGENG